MSTKSSLYYHEGVGEHKIRVHVYREMHEPEDTVSVEISCSTCYPVYNFLMNEHLGRQLANLLTRDEKPT